MLELDDKDFLAIKTPDGIHNTYGFEIFSRNHDLIANAHAVIVEWLNHEQIKNLRYFIQGMTPEWIYIEFFKDTPETHNAILSFVLVLESITKLKAVIN